MGNGVSADCCHGAQQRYTPRLEITEDEPPASNAADVAEEIAEVPPAVVSAADTEWPETCVATEARDLLGKLRLWEAAAQLERDRSEKPDEEPSKGIAVLEEAARHQLETLNMALEKIQQHPGLRKAGLSLSGQPPQGLPNTLLGVPVCLPAGGGEATPTTPATVSSATSSNANSSSQKLSFDSSGNADSKRDRLQIDFDLDDKGHRVEAVVEFFADGTASLQWTAIELPVPMPIVVCLVHEVDLIGEIAPFIKSAEVLHQFPTNEADRLIRIVSAPPIPFVKGFEAVTQRFGFDLLETPWAGLCIVDVGPTWTSSSSGASWRGFAKPPPPPKGVKQVDTKTLIALGCPTGPKGDLVTILFSVQGDLKVPRSVLPNWLITWLVKLIGRYVFKTALSHVASLDESAHGSRLANNPGFYGEINAAIARFTAARE